MKIDVCIINHNAVPLRPLTDILGELERAGKTHYLMYLHAKYPDGRECEHGWVGWRNGGLFTDPFTGEFFFADKLDVEKSEARLLQPNEVMHIKYHGEPT